MANVSKVIYLIYLNRCNNEASTPTLQVQSSFPIKNDYKNQFKQEKPYIKLQLNFVKLKKENQLYHHNIIMYKKPFSTESVNKYIPRGQKPIHLYSLKTFE